MPRAPRNLIEGGIYHVYNRTIEALPVFDEPAAVEVFLDLFREIKTRDGWVVFAWCLMRNHYHLVVRCGVIPLSRGMRSLDGRFSQWFNQTHGRRGPLWQHRYKSRWVNDGKYLRQVIIYVHLNPVRAGISTSPVEYLLSGHSEMLVSTPGSLTDMDDSLLVFGETVLTGRHAYAMSLAAAVGQEDFTHAVELKLWQSDEDRALKPAAAACIDPLGRSTGHDRPTIRPDLFVSAFCELTGTDFERLAGRQRDQEIARNRQLIATLGIERWRQKASDLAKVLNKNPDVVSEWATRGGRHKPPPAGWAAQIDDLDERMVAFWCEGGGLTS